MAKLDYKVGLFSGAALHLSVSPVECENSDFCCRIIEAFGYDLKPLTTLGVLGNVWDIPRPALVKTKSKISNTHLPPRDFRSGLADQSFQFVGCPGYININLLPPTLLRAMLLPEMGGCSLFCKGWRRGGSGHACSDGFAGSFRDSVSWELWE